MLQLKNHSPFAAQIGLFPNEQGVDTLYVVVKASFSLTAQPQVLEEQPPVTLQDEYWGDPESTGIKYAGEMHLRKPTTDVALVGQAWAPGGRHATQLQARLKVGEREKTLLVRGNRVWQNGRPGEPEPFERMPMFYEYAFGGTHIVDPDKPEILAEERNPIGRGFRGKRNDQELESMPLPNIEDPRCPVETAGDKAWPAGFAFMPSAWLPRRGYAGTYDEAWQKQRAPYLPKDFDSRFFNAAHPEFIYDRYLAGGEPIELDNLSKHGPLRLQLPQCAIDASVRIAARTEKPRLNMETVLIEPESERFSMTWRGEVQCDKKALKIEQIDINLLDLQHARSAA